MEDGSLRALGQVLTRAAQGIVLSLKNRYTQTLYCSALKLAVPQTQVRERAVASIHSKVVVSELIDVNDVSVKDFAYALVSVLSSRFV